jgi:ferredoxin-NADP reductase
VLVERSAETATAVTLVLEVDAWPGHLAGQHVDVRLTAEDGYQAVRSYSLAAPADGDHIRLTVARVESGEVSPYLCDSFAVGDRLEVRGPLGGWFVWRPDDRSPVLLVAGGSGLVPLMAMVRSRNGEYAVPFRLVASVRSPGDLLFQDELRRRASEDDGLDVVVLYTREAPAGHARAPGRITAEDLSPDGAEAADVPTCYVCGPTGFVEHAARLLVDVGHDPGRIRTERFGPTGR